MVNTVEEIEGLKPLSGNCITVAMSGSVMKVLLKRRILFILSHKILRPKQPMSDEVMHFYCYALRSNNWKYSFGRQANKTIDDLEIPSLEKFLLVRNFKYPRK